ncbi:MAG: outer membrane lipid asymmetry maintenance protein MlaD [Candidatus Endonucleobacter bathymodioli]|uniref:Outer membrane lipid asymmetry maintenance protein MlaD n=1 Tax=Candidatus Endonucleibacter bathymodioli TaxID=539814 RepID=A0AA90SSK7_9GAMM|nr:outer membrane lipid asymmetry maintenance protein MlaD [Candidatus Endonucleobacter bathymodioli]
MKMRTIEIGVGAFMLAGILAMFVLALKVSGLSFSTNKNSYHLYAMFDNTGTLKKRAKVTLAGVIIGKVTDVSLDNDSYRALVDMEISSEVNNIPIDSTASIVTSGLLGEKYIGIGIGGDMAFLKSGERIEDTQSALVLEDLIGKVMLALVNKKDDK